MIKLAQIVKEIMDTSPPVIIKKQNVQQSPTNVLSSDFINYIKYVENDRKVGYDSIRKLWFPHKSYEGGMPIIGYGHKIKNKQELVDFDKGIADDMIEKLLKFDLTEANKRVHEYIKTKYKINLTLNQKQNEMLTDFSFNLGGLEKFPKFTDAVLRNQMDIAKKEYKRFSGGKELTARNESFYNRFFK